MAKGILVAYDTLHGSTTEVAEFIGKELAKAGKEVEVHRVGEVKDVGDYQAVVVGCPVIAGKWTDDARGFLSRNQPALGQRPVALFTLCLAPLWGAEGYERAMSNYVNPLLEEFSDIKTLRAGVFCGVLDYDNYPEDMRERMRQILSAAGAPMEGRHDYRDWDAISTWTGEIGAGLG